MKLYIGFTLLFGTSLTLAQGLPDVPTCSLQCFLNAMSSDGCPSLTDFACHCREPALVEQVTPCVEQACSEPDQSSVSNVVMTACSSAGVPISIPPVGATTATTTGDGPTTTGESATPSSVNPSGPLMTPSTSTDTTTPMSSPSTPGVSSQLIPSDPAATSSQFLGGAGSFRAGGKLAGAAAAIAAGYLM
ncbi:CFEM domain-containing protein [Aspergillus mulundensis]|uniref:CFEM domain-containing protein n=1 Tax=Aspergillus mulundensis TaxID=1810919 RepID=A0A3D8RY97_9EURO|nr:hypothetical protein DSM5745_05881 [Aspergillus mulundensis]RDW79029.1 hypothetical protein DSM5745_05881 [Aspergillus mulundensis]